MMIDVEKTIQEMTLEEKASLCSGLGYWDTKALERFGIKSFIMTDGPNGVRMQEGTNDRFGLNESAKATCFPTGSCLASSWDTGLLYEVGAAIGREAKAKNVSLVLGPAVNMKRSPLCGRNFEYLSEDPLLAGKLGAAYVKGMQKQGVGASPKHFAANNQERYRQTIDSRVDERTLREIYLKVFEIIVKESAPWMMMSSYNQINGEFASQNRWLLHDVLRKEWGYKGLMVTDWYGTNVRPMGVAAGQDLEMPGNGGISDKEIVDAVRAWHLSQNAVDECVRHFLRLYNLLQDGQGQPAADYEENHRLACRAAAEGSVLLKNDEAVLPLEKGQKIAVIGAFAKQPRYQGGGSSHLNANQMDVPWDAFCRRVDNKLLSYSQGYDVSRDEPDETLIKEAVDRAREADVAVIFCGLTDNFESEAFDRETMSMPESHNRLIRDVAHANPNTVVVLENGSPVEMPWLDDVKGVLESYLGGEAGGSAAVELLYGDTNPSGKLAETFPLRLEDNPSYLNFPGCAGYVEYREGIFIGYRYYASAKVKPLFPFGYGLSYTTFDLSDVHISAASYRRGEKLPTVSGKIKNTGHTAGKEVMQVYVKAPGKEAVRPVLELKGFTKVFLEPGEEKQVEIEISDLDYWNGDLGSWELEGGDYEILVGTSSENLPFRLPLRVTGTVRRKSYDHNTMLGELLEHKTAGSWARHTREEFTKAMTGGIENTHTKLLLERSTLELPLLVLRNTGFLPPERLKMLLAVLNGEEIEGQDISWLADEGGRHSIVCVTDQ